VTTLLVAIGTFAVGYYLGIVRGGNLVLAEVRRRQAEESIREYKEQQRRWELVQDEWRNRRAWANYMARYEPGRN